MIVNNLYIMDIAFTPCKTNAPLKIDPNDKLPFTIPMQAIEDTKKTKGRGLAPPSHAASSVGAPTAAHSRGRAAQRPCD